MTIKYILNFTILIKPGISGIKSSRIKAETFTVKDKTQGTKHVLLQPINFKQNFKATNLIRNRLVNPPQFHINCLREATNENSFPNFAPNNSRVTLHHKSPLYRAGQLMWHLSNHKRPGLKGGRITIPTACDGTLTEKVLGRFTLHTFFTVLFEATGR